MPVQTRFHIRRKVFALLVCLVFSTFLWFLNDLNRVQTVNVEIPVRFTGLPYDMVSTNSLPNTMQATVEATGFDLLWRSYTSQKRVVEIPLRLEKGGAAPGKTYLFNINYYLQDISDELGSHVKIKRIFPDTFSIRFEKRFIKRVPVRLASNLQFEKEFNISGDISLVPDSVTISGTKENIAKVDSVFTENLILKGLKKNYSGDLKLESLNGVTYNVENIDVQIPVEQFTEKTISLKISTIGVPANYELNTIPDVVNLKLFVPLSMFNKIKADEYMVAAEFPDPKSTGNKILLKVVSKPSFVKVISLDPGSVEYKVKAK